MHILHAKNLNIVRHDHEYSFNVEIDILFAIYNKLEVLLPLRGRTYWTCYIGKYRQIHSWTFAAHDTRKTSRC